MKHKQVLRSQNSYLGLTLLEMLIAISIFSILMSAVYHFFWTGKRTYLSLKNHQALFSDTPLAFHIFERDLSRIYAWNDLHFYANADHIYFYSKQMALSHESLSRIDYQIKKKQGNAGVEHSLIRFQTVFPKVIKEPLSLETPHKILLGGQKNMKWYWLAKTTLTSDELKELVEENRDNPETIPVASNFKWRWFKKWNFRHFPVAYKVLLVSKYEDQSYTFSQYITPLSNLSTDAIPVINLNNVILKNWEDWIYEENT